MTGNLYDYFGVIGLLSIAGWIAALALLAVGARHRRRHHAWLLALALAVVAFALAAVNSRRVSAIRVDRTVELEAARQRAEAARREAAGGLGAQLQFAEDAPGEAARVAIDSGQPTRPADDQEPWYKQQGKQARDPARRDMEAAPVLAAGEAPEPAGRALPELDVLRANRWDDRNLLAVRLTLLLCLVAVIGDWLARLQDPWQAYFPLPVTGRWLDELFPHAARGQLARPAATPVPAFLESTARKGQVFLYLGPQDPWPAAETLSRGAVGKWTWAHLPLLRPGQPGVPADSEFLFECLWYGRYGIVVTDPARARQLLNDLPGYLEPRRQTRARTRRPVRVVWDFTDLDSAPPVDERLIELCRQANWTLVLTGRTG